MRRGQGSMISVPFLIACLQAETAGRIWMKRMMIAALCLLLCGCQSVQEDTLRVSQTEDAPAQLVAEQVLEGESGTIHYSYQLPEGYHETGSYPMMVVMPGYDMMWFGEDSSGANLDWQGFRCWSDLDEEMIVVSAQLTDWGETSARQAIELTEHFLDDFAVDAKRVYAAGYSAGGETMSRAVSMRPDLYAAYLHAASQWDGDLVRSQRMMSASTSTSDQMTNTMDHSRHRIRMTRCMRRIRRMGEAMNRSPRCCRSRCPMTHTLPSREQAAMRTRQPMSCLTMTRC